MTDIAIARLDATTYRVTLDGEGSRTVHDVTVSMDHVARYAPGADPERLLEASFEFLLQREPKESILTRFELPTIERYFPDYAANIRARLTRES